MFWYIALVLLVGYIVGSTRNRTLLRMKSADLRRERAEHAREIDDYRQMVDKLQDSAEYTIGNTNRLIDAYQLQSDENAQLVNSLDELLKSYWSLHAQHERTLAVLN